MHCTTRALLASALGGVLPRISPLPPPSFLLPAFNGLSQQTASFSVSLPLSKRRRKGQRDGNPWRHVSALRHTGLGRSSIRLSVKPKDLPQPVLDPMKRSTVDVAPDHGLWGFFAKDREGLITPLEMASHGRGWTVPELRVKDWEDLHKLWWVCIKELNVIETTRLERERIGDMFGEQEEDDRMKAVKSTMKSIRQTLIERWYAWEDARVAAMDDPEVNLYADPEKGEPAYVALDREDEDLVVDNAKQTLAGPGQDIPPPNPSTADSGARV